MNEWMNEGFVYSFDRCRLFCFIDAAGWTTSGWLPDPPSYSAEFKTPNESYSPYTTQYATPYNYGGGQQQSVVIVQPQVGLKEQSQLK